MEYRGIEYTVVQDEHGNWHWSVSLGNPERSNQAKPPPKALR
jgi:hypothetical protein